VGFRTLKEMVGQSQKTECQKAIKHYKASGLDLSTILYKPEKAKTVPNHNTTTGSRPREHWIFKLSRQRFLLFIERKTRINFKIKIQTVLSVLF
jgi:glutamate synthase (ferredoxin)